MIQVTMTFATLAEAAAVLTAANGVAVPLAVSTAGNVPPAPKPAAPASAPAAAAPSPAKAPAAASPSPAPTPAPAAQGNPLAGEAGYKVLQSAVFKLAAMDNGVSAGAINTAFGVKTMKLLPEERRGEALAAVEARIAELQAAQNEVA